MLSDQKSEEKGGMGRQKKGRVQMVQMRPMRLGETHQVPSEKNKAKTNCIFAERKPGAVTATEH